MFKRIKYTRIHINPVSFTRDVEMSGEETMKKQSESTVNNAGGDRAFLSCTSFRGA